MSARLCDAFEVFKSLIPADLDPSALQVWKEDGASILLVGDRPRAHRHGGCGAGQYWGNEGPGAAPIRVTMIAERRSGRLLGAQVVGQEAAAKRVDALAICIWNEMTVDEILSLDLSYAPPFSPVWDPVLIAARKAFEAVEADVRSL